MSSEGALTPGDVYKGTYTSGLIGGIFYELEYTRDRYKYWRPARGDKKAVGI